MWSCQVYTYYITYKTLSIINFITLFLGGINHSQYFVIHANVCKYNKSHWLWATFPACGTTGHLCKVWARSAKNTIPIRDQNRAISDSINYVHTKFQHNWRNAYFTSPVYYSCCQDISYRDNKTVQPQ